MAKAWETQKNHFNLICRIQINLKTEYFIKDYFLQPEKKVHLGFFSIMSTSILGNGTVILLLPRKI